MRWQELAAQLHQAIQKGGTSAIATRGERFGPGLAGDGVRRRARHLGIIAPCRIDENVAIADTGIESQSIAERGLDIAPMCHEVFDEHAGFTIGDRPCRVVEHQAVVRSSELPDGDEVETKNPITGGWVEPESSGFEGSAAGVIAAWVVAQKAHGADIGASFPPGRRGDGGADASVTRNFGSSRHACRLQGSLPAEFIEREIASAVGNDDDVFHTRI